MRTFGRFGGLRAAFRGMFGLGSVTPPTSIFSRFLTDRAKDLLDMQRQMGVFPQQQFGASQFQQLQQSGAFGLQQQQTQQELMMREHQRAVEQALRGPTETEADYQGRLWAQRMREWAQRTLPEYVLRSNGFLRFFEECMREFNREIAQGRMPHVTVANVDAEFIAFFHIRLVKSPEMRAAVGRMPKPDAKIGAFEHPTAQPNELTSYDGAVMVFPAVPTSLSDLLAETIEIGREVLAAI